MRTAMRTAMRTTMRTTIRMTMNATMKTSMCQIIRKTTVTKAVMQNESKAQR
jgi:hypothetical protein